LLILILSREDTDLGPLYDPLNNNFTISKKKKSIEEKKKLLCLLCNKRFKLVYCKTCLNSYCFNCAFMSHGMAKNHHDMIVINPYIDNDFIEKSVLYHLNNVNDVKDNLKEILRNLG
jgi:late competence protein required for DNA uptake (superfamily II DNA/RNA helicase)